MIDPWKMNLDVPEGFCDRRELLLVRSLGIGLRPTVGCLFVGGYYVCNTLELPWRDNQREISCIPEGEYDVEWTSSARFGVVPLVKNVPGRSNILFHKGNTVKDTHGCILVGDYSFVGESLRGSLDAECRLSGWYSFWRGAVVLGEGKKVPVKVGEFLAKLKIIRA